MSTSSMAQAAGPIEAERGGNRWLALTVIVSAQLLVVLDSTVVAIALPSAQNDLGLSDANRQWILTAYTLAFGGLLLFGGRLADRIGLRQSLIIGIVGFGVVSAIGGAAVGGWMLIAARVAQGAFAALIAPSTLALLNVVFPDKKERGKAFGIYSATLVAGGALGLLIGGTLTEYLDWRWCMYVNVPVTVLALLGAMFLLPRLPGHPEIKIDLPGAALGAAGIAALVYGFGQAASKGWGSPEVIAGVVAGPVLLAAFGYLQNRRRNPLLPLRIIANRNRAGSFFTMAMCSIGLFGVLLILTYQFQLVLRYTPLQTGVAFLPLLFANVSVSGVAATLLLPRVPPRFLLAPGLLVAALGLFMLTRATPDSTYWGGIFPGELVLGAGLGTVMAPAAATATGGVAKDEIGIASAFFNTSTQIGASIGTALLNTAAASAIGTYLTQHPGVTRGSREATLYGSRIAGLWGVGLLVFAAIFAAVLINAPTFQPDPDNDDPIADTAA